MESKFIAAILSDRGAYEEVKDTLETADFSDLGTLIINQAIDFYKADPAARHVDNDVLLSRISRVHPAQEKLVANFLANMEPVSIPNMLQEYVDIRLASLARHLSQRMATGKVDPETRELIAQYQFLEERREAGLRDEEDNEVSIGLSVDSVLEALAPEQLVPIFPRQLNDAIGGGAPPGTHIVVFARPECYSADTEVLTDRGWKFVADVDCTDKLATVDNERRVFFEYPFSSTKRDDFQTAYRIYNKKGQIDLIVSPEHNMVYEKDGKWCGEPANEIKYRQGIKTHVSAMGNVPENSWMLSPEDMFKIAYQADGRERVYETHGYSEHIYGYELSFKKEIKVSAFRSIMEEGEFEYTEWVDSRGYSSFYVKTNVFADKSFGWIDLDKVDSVWAQCFARELSFWDGSRRSETRWKYSNTNEEAIDKAQAVVALSGYNCLKSSVPDKRGYRTCHELHIRSNYTPLDGQSIIKEEIPWEGPMYCFSVSTGKLLVRRRGAMVVCGNTGKTMFCVNMLCGFLTNGRKALYIGNEDPASNIKMRIINNITGMPKAEVESDRVRADRIVEEVVEDRLIYADLHPGSPGDVRSLVAKHRPDVVLVDQIRNLRTPRSFTKVEGLEYIAKEMRNIGKEFGCVMVSVTQAGDSADGKIELGMGDIDFSNTGIPATADVLIGIGCTPQMEMFGKRKLSLPKNKLSGNHNSIDVDVNPALSEVK